MNPPPFTHLRRTASETQGFALPARARWRLPRRLSVGVALAATLSSNLALAAPPAASAESSAQQPPCPANVPVNVPVNVQPEVSPTTAADSDLVEHNRKLTAQAQEGERWLIGGRIGAGLGVFMTAGGIAMLSVYGVRNKKYNDQLAQLISDPGLLDPTEDDVPFNGGAIVSPPSRGLAAGGALVLMAGLGGLGASVWAMMHGGKLMRSARDGQLALSAGPGRAGLSLRGRF